MFFLVYLSLLVFAEPPETAPIVVGTFKTHEACVIAGDNLARPIGGEHPAGIYVCAKILHPV